MRFFIDTNVFVEVILEQERASEARNLLSKVHEYDFFISDLSFHSIGFILFRRKLHHSFGQFSKDMIQDAGTTILSLPIEDMDKVISSAFEFNLDFDDAYQYVVAEKYDLTIMSFDGDFDRTHRGRKTPQDILNESKNA
jgi:predicted nucleic acid-binding protein